MVRYRTITTKDPEYTQEKELRDRILRRPLGLALSAKDLQGEDEQVHIIASDEQDRVVGCVLVAFAGEQAKIRQIAIDKGYQGRGVGTQLIKAVEQAALARNVGTVMLHARVTAREFFEKLGYKVTSTVFTEVTIPHIEMEKRSG
jgi:predicted GNAT family N-acyltransferase